MLQARARGWCAHLVWCPLASWIGDFGPDPTFLLGEPNSNNPAPQEHNPGPGSLLATHPLGVWLLPRLSAPSDTPTEMPTKHTDAQSRRGWSLLFCVVTKVTAQAWWLPATPANLSSNQGSWAAPGGILLVDLGAAVAPSRRTAGPLGRPRRRWQCGQHTAETSARRPHSTVRNG